MEYQTKEASNIMLGQLGFDAITDTAAHTGSTWVAFKAVHGDAVISSATSDIGDNLPSAMTLSEGDVVYGMFSAVTLSSGKILAYRG
jgi:hypothetical protein